MSLIPFFKFPNLLVESNLSKLRIKSERSGETVLGVLYWTLKIRLNIMLKLSCLNGTLPVTISNITTPSAHQSTGLP